MRSVVPQQSPVFGGNPAVCTGYPIPAPRQPSHYGDTRSTTTVFAKATASAHYEVHDASSSSSSDSDGAVTEFFTIVSLAPADDTKLNQHQAVVPSDTPTPSTGVLTISPCFSSLESHEDGDDAPSFREPSAPQIPVSDKPTQNADEPAATNAVAIIEPEKVTAVPVSEVHRQNLLDWRCPMPALCHRLALLPRQVCENMGARLSDIDELREQLRADDQLAVSLRGTLFDLEPYDALPAQNANFALLNAYLQCSMDVPTTVRHVNNAVSWLTNEGYLAYSYNIMIPLLHRVYGITAQDERSLFVDVAVAHRNSPLHNRLLTAYWLLYRRWQAGGTAPVTGTLDCAVNGANVTAAQLLQVLTPVAEVFYHLALQPRTVDLYAVDDAALKEVCRDRPLLQMFLKNKVLHSGRSPRHPPASHSEHNIARVAGLPLGKRGSADDCIHRLQAVGAFDVVRCNESPSRNRLMRCDSPPAVSAEHRLILEQLWTEFKLVVEPRTLKLMNANTVADVIQHLRELVEQELTIASSPITCISEMNPQFGCRQLCTQVDERTGQWETFVCGKDKAGRVQICIMDLSRLNIQFVHYLMLWCHRELLFEPLGRAAQINLLIDYKNQKLLNRNLINLLTWVSKYYANVVHTVYLFNTSFLSRPILHTAISSMHPKFQMNVQIVVEESQIRSAISSSQRLPQFCNGRINGFKSVSHRPIAFIPS